MILPSRSGREPKSPLPHAGGVGGGTVRLDRNPLKKDPKHPTARSWELRQNPSDAETRLGRCLSGRRVAGTRFNRLFPMGPFVCDFASRGAKLVIEIDGDQHSAHAVEDEQRTKFLTTKGYRVIRFWNHDVLSNIEGVVAEIERIRTDSPSPIPSRERAGRSRESPDELPSRLREGLGEGLSNP